MALGWRGLAGVMCVLAAAVCAGYSAQARPVLVVDLETGIVLHAEDATQPWFPASLTKLLTVYVALEGVRAGQLTLDTPLTYSARAGRERPSKMGFKPGTILTLDNALKILMVKSANDIAVMIAENISGSVEEFVGKMNSTAQQLGMTQSRFANPNGWWVPDQVSTARDLAILARALLLTFPEHRDLFGIPALRLGKNMMRNTNGLIGRYPGAAGMKTGFTCPSGFNLVGAAQRDGRQLITVVLGASSARERTEEAAELLEQGFEGTLRPQIGRSLMTMPFAGGTAPNLREVVCGAKPKNKIVGESTRHDDEDEGPAALAGLINTSAPRRSLLMPRPRQVKILDIFLGPNPSAPGNLAVPVSPIVPLVKMSEPLDLRGGIVSTPTDAIKAFAPVPRARPRPLP
jgi:D-alanyl-D-alanine carboxypeptidase